MWEQVMFHRLRCAGDGCHIVSEPRRTRASALAYARSALLWIQIPDGNYVCPDCAEQTKLDAMENAIKPGF